MLKKFFCIVTMPDYAKAIHGKTRVFILPFARSFLPPPSPSPHQIFENGKVGWLNFETNSLEGREINYIYVTNIVILSLSPYWNYDVLNRQFACELMQCVRSQHWAPDVKFNTSASFPSQSFYQFPTTDNTR